MYQWAYYETASNGKIHTPHIKMLVTPLRSYLDVNFNDKSKNAYTAPERHIPGIKDSPHHHRSLLAQATTK